MSRLLWAGLGAGGLGWYLWRKGERDALEARLSHDPLYTQLAVIGLVPSPAQAAEEAISFSEAVTAEDAYALLTADLPKLPGPTPSSKPELKLVDQLNEFERLTGVKVPRPEKWFDFGTVESFEEVSWGEWFAGLDE